MNEIRSLLRIARRRLETSRFLGHLHLVAIVVASAALLLLVGERLGATLFVPWIWVGPVLAGAALLVAAGLWAVGRMSEQRVAIEVDDRLDLRERFSTALHCAGRDDAFARAAVEDAITTARDRRTAEVLRRRFGVTAPRQWWVSPLIVFAALMMTWIEPLDLFASEDPDGPGIQQASVQAEQSVEMVAQAARQEDEELHDELRELLEGMEPTGLDQADPRSADDIRRDTIRTLSDLNRRLEDILSGERGRTGEALEAALSRLQPPSDGPASEFAEALADGNFEQASEALQELLERLANGELDADEQEQLAEQLEDIAEQLEELARLQDQLEDALREAGLDPQLAQNPEALEQALQDPNLNEQQRQQLQQAQQAQQQAQQMCQGLGQACQQMAQAMQGGQPGQMGQAGEQLAQQLGQMEQLQQLLRQAQAAANACAGQCEGIGQGLAMQQLQQMFQQQPRPGNGMGNWGQGRGGRAPLSPTPTGEAAEQALVHTTAGDIIGSTQIQTGQFMIGDSQKTPSEIIAEMNQSFDEAIAEDELPRRYHEAQQHYFGELESQVRRAEEAAAAGGRSNDGETSGDDSE